MTSLTFTVPGIAQSKGSARAFTYTRRPERGGGIGARVDNDNPKAKAWQAVVANAALVARGGGRYTPYAGPVHLQIEFYLPRPQRPKAAAHITKPDLDKICRCAIDGMTGVLFLDDAQVVSLVAGKSYVRRGESPRAEITIRPLSLAQGTLAEVAS